MKNTSVLFKAFTVASLLCVNYAVSTSPAFAKHAPGYVKMMHVTMDDGGVRHYEVVKINDRMMVLIPERDIDRSSPVTDQ